MGQGFFYELFSRFINHVFVYHCPCFDIGGGHFPEGVFIAIRRGHGPRSASPDHDRVHLHSLHLSLL